MKIGRWIMLGKKEKGLFRVFSTDRKGEYFPHDKTIVKDARISLALVKSLEENGVVVHYST